MTSQRQAHAPDTELPDGNAEQTGMPKLHLIRCTRGLVLAVYSDEMGTKTCSRCRQDKLGFQRVVADKP
jgi:hypothetical protein